MKPFSFLAPLYVKSATCALLFVLILPLSARAHETNDEIHNLLDQITSLTEVVASLQAQLTALQGGETRSDVLLTRNLALGSKGDDVRTLQILLNRDPETQIAISGDGAPGFETDFFGPKTEIAVIAFQNKHTADVLAPIGESRGTGFVGSLTRNKLQELYGENIDTAAESVEANMQTSDVAQETETVEIPDVEALLEDVVLEDTGFSEEDVATLNAAQVTVSGATDFIEYQELNVFYPEKYEVVRGEEITLLGAGFTQTNNTLFIGDKTISGIPSETGAGIRFTIPSDIDFGIADIQVSNALGVSTNPAFVVVVDDNINKPTISTSTPATARFGATITVTGTHFEPTGNTIHAGWARIENIASLNGTTLSFPFEPFPNDPYFQMDLDGENFIDFTFYISNKNGLSEGFGVIKLEL